MRNEKAVPKAKQPPHILVVDDEPSMLRYLRTLLEVDSYRVTAAGSGAEALELIAEGPQPDLVLLDSFMPEMDGLELLGRLRESQPDLKVIMLSCVNDNRRVVHAMRLGARDFLSKPFRKQDLDDAISQALNVTPHNEKGEIEGEEIHLEGDKFFVFASAAMREIRAQATLVARVDLPVLLLGESGTGKEVLAHFVHKMSPRARKPFLKVNCAAMPPDLLESELFGYEPGAFTGATRSKPGKFELCDNGTILLDEIGEMHPALQAKLLQVLQDEEYYRVGGKRPLRSDARVVVATNRVLEDEIARGNFREDLYYRLNVVSVIVPPLRERKEDVPHLIEHFRRKYGSKYKQGTAAFSDEVMRKLLQYDYPGNVRELENLVRRLVVLRDDRFVLDELNATAARRPAMQTQPPAGPAAGALPPANQGTPQPPRDHSHPPAPVVQMIGNAETVSLKEIARQAALRAEREAISAMLARTNWNKRKAAARLQISYKALLYKIKDCGLTDLRITAGLPDLPPMVLAASDASRSS